MFLRPQWPRSEYKASAPVVHRNTAPSSQKPLGYTVSSLMAHSGLRAWSTAGWCRIWTKPKVPMVLNHRNMMGPNAAPTTLVPNCWKPNSSVMMTSTMVMMVPSVRAGSMSFSPSIAEDTEMGGVMMPSARSVPAPMMAGHSSHLPRCRTSE